MARVVVGLSGGVDSAVSAVLLQQQGYDVVGVFVQTWVPDWMECSWRDDRRDAMRVAIHLGIPFHDLDLSDLYKRDVADYMISEYRTGRTPNPDVMCNRVIKFGGLWDFAQSLGAQYVATGHYARIENGKLLEGIDQTKDQSYFLWMLRSDELNHILFPIGHLQKTQVRTLAQEYSLPVATKRDSQGICFLGDVDMTEFLSHYIDTKPGNVLDADGNVIGHHDGAVFVTLGQRHGFTVTKKTPDTGRWYVVDKDISNNTITVSPYIYGQSGDRDGARHCVYLLDRVNMYTSQSQFNCDARIRYHGQRYPVTVLVDGSVAQVTFSEPLLIAPGQSVVLYEGDRVIGGGIVRGRAGHF